MKLDKNQGIPFNLVSYKIDIKITLKLDYSGDFGRISDGDKFKTISVLLTPENNYTSDVSVIYKSVPVYGKYHIMTSTVLVGMLNIFGADISKDALDPSTKLESTKLIYEITSMKGQ